MATFGKSSFSHESYANFRPAYPPHLYDIVLAFHKGPRRVLIDLGTGHGLISRSLAHAFEEVVGTDPSEGMIDQAKSATKKDDYPNIDYIQASAEALPFLEDGSVDMVVAGQAAHWFDYPRFFEEMQRIIRPGGTLAIWGYTDHVFRGHPRASEILHTTTYGLHKDQLGSYWQQPGRSIVQNYLRDIKPPSNEWEVDRRERDLSEEQQLSRDCTLVMEKSMTVAMNMAYIRTWSSYHGWQESHQGQTARSIGGPGDVVDEMFEEMRGAEPEWEQEEDWWEKQIEVEWGTALVLARKKG